jgi:hypothetical protein
MMAISYDVAKWSPDCIITMVGIDPVNGLLTLGINVWEFLSHSGLFYKTSKGIRDMKNQNF